MPNTLEQTGLQVIDAALREGGVVATYKAQGAGPGVPVKIHLSLGPRRDVRAPMGRSMNPPGDSHRHITGTLMCRTALLGQAGHADGTVENLRADDLFIVPGPAVGRPADGTCTLRFGKSLRMESSAYWLAEVHL